VAFVTVGLVTVPRGATFELDRALMRPMYLVTLGSLILYWAAHETRLRRRLALLRDAMTLSNPRFGIDQTLQSVLARLRGFYGADSCHLLTAVGEGEPTLRLQSEPSRTGAGTALSIGPGVSGELFQDLSDQAAILYRASRWWQSDSCDVLNGDVLSRFAPEPWQRRLGALLGAGSFMTVPWPYEPGGRGWLLLVSDRRPTFHPSDLMFVRQLTRQLTPVLANIQLVERLASRAAEEERRRIAGDIHDSIIQPYVGLRLAIAGVREQLRAGAAASAVQALDRVAELADAEVDALRGFVQSLRDGQPSPRFDALETAIQRLAERYAAVSGMKVEFRTAAPLALNDRLAAEVFQMVSEGLSNIRRHTDATAVVIRLRCEGGRMCLSMTDNGGASAEAFRPRSLDDRARALGGTMQRRQMEGQAVMEIQVPL
jgi:signal transduction histidine kinase